MEERLQKILARAGIASRRQAEEIIRQGKVRIDGQVVREMGLRVDPGRHRIEYEGRAVSLPERKYYILLNKPKGYVTTVKDPQGRPVVVSLVKEVPARVYPVGRLDLQTEGALLLTNDGGFAHRVLHPRHEIEKTYLARVAGRPLPQQLERLEKGIDIEGRLTWPAKVKIIRASQQNTLLQVTIHEGRKRQIRKMCQAIGHPVLSLKRIAYGKLSLGNLPAGKYRFLTRKDLELIFAISENLENGLAPALGGIRPSRRKRRR